MPQRMLVPDAILPDLAVRELQAIRAVAEQGSFMAAALTLGVSQPALTRTVQRVERALGIELFRRTTRRMEVTAAGRQFVAMANRVLNDLRLSFDGMRDMADEQRGIVIISAVMSVAYSRMPRIVAGYQEVRPRIEVQLHEGVHDTVLEAVRSGVSDIGVTYLDEVPSEYERLPLGKEAFHVVLPSKHPLANKKGISLIQAAKFGMVSLPREAQTRRLIDGLAASAGLPLRHVLIVDQFATLMECVNAGVGLAIVPGGAIPTTLGAGLISRPLAKPSVRRTIGAVMLKGRSLTPSARGFLSHLQTLWDARPGRDLK